MNEINLKLTPEEGQQLMNRLINSDPLLLKIAAQMREQQVPPPQPGNPPNIAVPGNGQGGLS